MDFDDGSVDFMSDRDLVVDSEMVSKALKSPNPSTLSEIFDTFLEAETLDGLKGVEALVEEKGKEAKASVVDVGKFEVDAEV